MFSVAQCMLHFHYSWLMWLNTDKPWLYHNASQPRDTERWLGNLFQCEWRLFMVYSLFQGQYHYHQALSCTVTVSVYAPGPVLWHNDWITILSGTHQYTDKFCCHIINAIGCLFCSSFTVYLQNHGHTLWYYCDTHFCVHHHQLFQCRALPAAAGLPKW